MQEPITEALITDCLILTVHTRKHYKALIDSGAAISLIRYLAYNLIDDSFKLLFNQQLLYSTQQVDHQ